MKKPDYKIPFNTQTGRMEPYADKWKVEQGLIKFEYNYTFFATMVYVGYYRGRSAAGLQFRDTKTNKHYEMFMTDFDKIVKLMDKGLLTGYFTFCKRGQNYGIKYVGETDEG